MKIKPFLAVTAFAASMSAFAQSAPPQSRGAERGPTGRPSTHAASERATLRRDINDFHRTQTQAAQDSPPAMKPAVVPSELAAHAADRGAKLHKDEEHERRRATKEGWAERRAEVLEAKEARRLKRQERHKEVQGPAAHHPAVSQH